MQIFAADIGGTKIKYGISDEKGNFAWTKETDTESKKGGSYIIRKLETIIEDYPTINAISLSTAGQVNHKDGYIIYANENIPQYTGMRIKDILEKKFQVPVVVENDVNAAIIGEKNFGDAAKYDNFIFLTFGTGIGGGIVIDSQLYRGVNKVAGEFGHIITHPNGLSCSCGNSGCYERYASTTALLKEAQKVNSQCTNGEKLFEEINNGDRELLGILDNWCQEVVVGLINVVHIFNPEAIVIGGGIMEQKLAVRKVSEKVKELVMPSFANVKIIKSSLGNKAGLYGVISLQEL
ncbi:ROK family protein [Gracilibacillus salitolerans]|uniref:ROK family protein n=1 Tax=Gracilibacillus salitolerans TaxID=2663022 RepID=A0A5Q2TNC3_9BACI|nr:ROK family protein [Gracilibacillus salitolerans]QGH36225.1 ROK family protein [Gracilibacillus salitolerans]